MLVIIHNNTPVVSHRVIAEQTQNQIVAVQNLINAHKADFEEFGPLHFKNEGVVNNGKGEQPKTYLLNEPQATLLMTYMRNSEIVRTFKKALVKAFYELKTKVEPKHTHPSITVDLSCPYWRQAYYKAFEGRCYYTGKSLSPAAFHLDHILPSSRGGTEAVDNIVLCDPSYNMSKGAMVDMQRIAKDQETVRTKYAHLVVLNYQALKNNLVSPLINPTQLLNKSTMEGLERYFGKAAMRDFYAKLIPGLRTDLIEANAADEKDTIDEFIRTCLTRSNDKIATRTVYEAFLEWCRLNNTEAIPLKELSRKIALKMAVPNKPVNINGKTTRAFVGVSIVSLGGAE